MNDDRPGNRARGGSGQGPRRFGRDTGDRRGRGPSRGSSESTFNRDDDPKAVARRERERERLLEGIGVPGPSTFVADAFQQDAISSVAEGCDTLVVAPTGSGKTYIAVEAIRAMLLQQLSAVYTTPLKALSNTKYNEFRKIFEPTYKVGLLTGDRKIDTNSRVVIATTEIYRNELYRNSERFSVVVLDEVHFIADPQRGPVWEESIILTPSSTTLLMLSASISNAEEIAEWISSVRGKPCRIIQKKERPVQLRFGFLHPEYGPLPLADEQGSVLKEVADFYGAMRLDRTGMRFQSERSSSGGGWRQGRDQGGRSQGGRDSHQPRGEQRGGDRSGGRGSNRGSGSRGRGR